MSRFHMFLLKFSVVIMSRSLHPAGDVLFLIPKQKLKILITESPSSPSKYPENTFLPSDKRSKNLHKKNSYLK